MANAPKKKSDRLVRLNPVLRCPLVLMKTSKRELRAKKTKLAVPSLQKTKKSEKTNKNKGKNKQENFSRKTDRMVLSACGRSNRTDPGWKSITEMI